MIKDKKIIITGANSGIGLETLKILSKDNKVFAADLNTDMISTFGDNVIPYQCDLSCRENIDAVFDAAVSSMGQVDIVHANAGFAYYEKMDYTDWDRMDRIFTVNTLAQIYLYQRFSDHLGDRNGVFALTISAMGVMGMPGFTLYSATKFALNGFQESVRFEKPDNMQLTCLYPVSTDTNFFKTASEIEFKRPYPLQTPDIVARKMVKGIEKRKKKVNPCKLFTFSRVLFKILPFTRTLYWRSEKKKFDEYCATLLSKREHGIR